MKRTKILRVRNEAVVCGLILGLALLLMHSKVFSSDHYTDKQLDALEARVELFIRVMVGRKNPRVREQENES